MLEQLLGGKKVARGSGLVGGLVSALGGAWVERLRHVADDLVDKAAALGIRVAAAGALFVAAVVFLLAGLKEGLVALGVPDWAASLGLAVLAGVAGWLALRRTPAGGGSPEEGRTSAPGLTVRIVREERTAPAPEAPVIDVHRAEEGWEVSAPRLRRGPEVFRTKQEALRAARRVARRRGGGRIVVHRSDGSVQPARRRPPA
ncbi:MAG TPA: DUF2188 domain-containing protein [Planctomycetota bacterium]|nr:DUF2188 domain-containing protein [Planctomycetota bacterium]